ncbi:hypothetical protein [Streptomyces sp. NBC_01724]|uniref:hypothetical protein n=1 Tax=Streptomyces sp. NBC_01724 TaxID=2975922 RepID=UPI003FCE23A3
MRYTPEPTAARRGGPSRPRRARPLLAAVTLAVFTLLCSAHAATAADSGPGTERVWPLDGRPAVVRG